LVTEDLAISVNSTHPSETNSTIVDKKMGGCAGMGENITCALKIRPPAVFDIADPFPFVYENFTKKGVFNTIENDLLANFSLGVHTIGWKAVDFTGNGNKTSDIVTQFVNLKLNGTNKISIVYDVNATVFSTVPQQITIIANNTDQDPLKFFIEDNPSKGILDTPIDAVFLTKFQKEGSISKLKGITNEGSDSDEIFFTDSRNARVLNITSMAETLMESFVGPQLGTPIAISKSGVNWDKFTISDWSENKIIQTTDNGTILKTFDVQGLFEKPEYLSVDKATGDIYVTDSINGTISILDDFGIFNSPKGIEVDKNSDTVYVVDEQDGEVKIFDSSGIFEKKFGTVGLNNGQFDQPNDVAVNSSNIFVADTNNNRIQIFDKDNNFVLKLGAFGGNGTAGDGDGEFDKPAGISVNNTHIFVADTNNNRIQIFNQT